MGVQVASEDRGDVFAGRLPFPPHKRADGMDPIRCHLDWSSLSLPGALPSFAL